MRASAEHRPLPSLALSLTAYRAWTDRDDAESDHVFTQIHRFPLDVDLTALDASGDYIAFPDDGVYGINPLYAYATHHAPVDGSRTILGAQTHWSPLVWLSVHTGSGYDGIDEHSRYLEQRFFLDGEPAGVVLRRLAHQRSLATMGLAVSGEAPVGPVAARYSAGWTSGTFRDSTFTGSSNVSQCPSDPLCGFDSYSISLLDLRHDTYTLQGALDYRQRYAVAAGLRYESNDLLPADEGGTFAHRLTLSWFPYRESWWSWTSLDPVTVRIARKSRKSVRSALDLTTADRFGILLGGEQLQAETEKSHHIVLEVGSGRRVWATIASAWSTTEGAIVRQRIPSPMGGDNWRFSNGGNVRRRSTLGTLGAELARGDWGQWTARVTADRSTLRTTDWRLPCFLEPPLYQCGGVDPGGLYGFRWMRHHAELPARHAGSHDAFAINGDGLLVPVGIGGSLADAAYGSTLVIDEVPYPWGMPIPAEDELGSTNSRIADVTPDFSLGLSTVLRWRGFTASANLIGVVGGDIYDRASQLRYLAGTHADADQAQVLPGERKPLMYYSHLGGFYSDWFVRDGGRLSIEELSLSHRFAVGPRGLGAVETVEISLVGRNLGGWSAHDWVGSADSSPWPWMDELMYPRPRSVTLRLTLSR